MDRRGLFIVPKTTRADDSGLVIEMAGLFSQLENLATCSESGTFNGREVVNTSGSEETGYTIFIAGGTSDFEHFSISIVHTVSEGKFVPGVYLLQDCPGGQTLTPDHRITFRDLLNCVRADFPQLKIAFKEFLGKKQ